MKKIEMAEGIVLPEDAVVQTFAFIGRKASGKTYAAGKLVEELVDSGSKVVVLDWVGNWYGLRLARDGKRRGLDMTIIGGRMQDVPIEPSAGEIVADAAVGHSSSLVIDVSEFTGGQLVRFATSFMTRLFQKQKATAGAVPVHLVIEEAQVIAPQFTGRSAFGQESRGATEAQMLGAAEKIVRIGRNYGIGTSLISQRPQSINKEVLNQAEPLLVFQLTGAHERKAVGEWTTYHGFDAKEMLGELSVLPQGECWFWSPQWAKIVRRCRVGAKRTYDSTSTPLAGGRGVVKLPAVDVEKFRAAMASAVERAKAEDPRELRRVIAERDAEIARLKKAKAPAVQVKAIDVRALRADIAKAIWLGVPELVQPVAESLGRAAADLRGAIGMMKDLPVGINKIARTCEVSAASNGSEAAVAPSAPRERVDRTDVSAEAPQVAAGSPEDRFAEAVRFWHSVGFAEVTDSQIASIYETNRGRRGMAKGGGTYQTYRSRAIGAGIVVRTPGGMRAAHPFATDIFQTPESRWEAISQLIPGALRAILSVVLERGPISSSDLAAAVGMAEGGGTFQTYRSRLSRMRLIERGDDGLWRRSEVVDRCDSF